MWEISHKSHRIMSRIIGIRIYVSRVWQSKPLDKDVHGRCQRRKNTMANSTSTRNETRHTCSGNSENTDNQSQHHFYQLEINTLGDARNTEGTQAQLKIQSPQCIHYLICKLDTGAEGNVIPLTTCKTMPPHCNETQDDIPTNMHPSNMRVTDSLHMEGIQSHTMAHASIKLHIEMNQCLVRFM